ncbi:MAG TPA: phosphoribosyltransferase family protein [Methylococcaceae bacterium]|nr:phosphoribosyltransferase family protein [Methylococcaceae bacterium]
MALYFQDRNEAARLLAEKLHAYKGRNPLVLAIPRGAVPMGAILAEALQGELDVVLVHKLGAPGNPEYAIGSIDEAGHVYLSDAVHAAGAGARYVEQAKQDELRTLQRRRAQYTPVRPPIDPAGRIVIVVDDGVATGFTMLAALRAVRAKKPAQLIAAMAVTPPDTLRRLKAEADEIVCLDAPDHFYAVGQFFADFPQVSDEEVIATLSRQPERPAGKTAPSK